MRHPTPAGRVPRQGVYLLLLGIVACAGSGSDGPGGAQDLAVTPVVTDLYRIGTVDGVSWDAFSRIGAVAFDPQGRLHVLEAESRRIAIVNRDGSLVRTFGSRGEGPGELRNPQSLAVLPDGRIVVSDLGHRAFLLFAEDGTHLGSHPMGDGPAVPGGRIHPQGTGSVVMAGTGLMIQATPGGVPVLPTTVPIRRWEFGEGGPPRLLHEAWRPEREAAAPTASAGGGGMQLAGAPGLRAFEPQLHLALLPDGRIAVADSSTYRIRVLPPDGAAEGGTPEVFGRELAPRPVEDADRATERERRLAELDAGEGPRVEIMTQGPGGPVSVGQDQIREMLRTQIQGMSFWPEIPVISGLAADPAGRLWVERREGPGRPGAVDLLDGNGRYLGTLTDPTLSTPEAFGPDGLAAWVEPDAFGVPFIRVARLEFDLSEDG